MASAHHHFHLVTRVLVPELFGVRMCLSCPPCNNDANDPQLNKKIYRFGCSTCRGANHKVMGAYQGIATSIGFAVEYCVQYLVTKHSSGNISNAESQCIHARRSFAAPHPKVCESRSTEFTC
eukprot:12012237-Karenia_brevis.AAC.1